MLPSNKCHTYLREMGCLFEASKCNAKNYFKAIYVTLKYRSTIPNCKWYCLVQNEHCTSPFSWLILVKVYLLEVMCWLCKWTLQALLDQLLIGRSIWTLSRARSRRRLQEHWFFVLSLLTWIFLEIDHKTFMSKIIFFEYVSPLNKHPIKGCKSSVFNKGCGT